MDAHAKKLDALIRKLANTRLVKGDFAWHFVRGSVAFIFLMFGYQK